MTDRLPLSFKSLVEHKIIKEDTATVLAAMNFQLIADPDAKCYELVLQLTNMKLISPEVVANSKVVNHTILKLAEQELVEIRDHVAAAQVLVAALLKDNK